MLIRRLDSLLLAPLTLLNPLETRLHLWSPLLETQLLSSLASPPIQLHQAPLLLHLRNSAFRAESRVAPAPAGMREP